MKILKFASPEIFRGPLKNIRMQSKRGTPMKSSLFLSLLSALLLTSCGQPPISLDTFENPVITTPLSAVPTIEFTLPYYPEESLHPTLVENQTNLTLAPLLYESLFQLDHSFTPQPYLVVDSTESLDGLQWDFTLNTEVTFWDSTPLTGDIVASALQEASSSQSRYAARFQEIRSITGYENQLTITLYRPNHNLPALLDIPISYGGGVLPQGTGPYTLSDNSSLVKNLSWWGHSESFLPDQIKLEPIQQISDLISAFDAGKLSLIDGNLTGTNALGYSGNYEVWEYSTTQMLYLGFHTGNVLKNATLRQFLSLAIDREYVTQTVLAGYGTPTIYPIHPNTNTGQLLPPLEYDPIQVAQLLENISFPSAPLELIFNGESREKNNLAQEIATQLSLFGIELKLVPLSWADYLNALEQGRFDLYLAEMVLSPDFDVTPLLSWGNLLNYGAYQDDLMLYYHHEYHRTGTLPLEILDNQDSPDNSLEPSTEAPSTEQADPLPTEHDASEETNFILETDALSQEEPSYESLSQEQFFAYFLQEMPFAPLCFKNGTMLSLWGHLQNASPVMDNLFYQLEDWTIHQDGDTQS